MNKLLLILPVLLFNLEIKSQLNVEWVKTYNGQYNYQDIAYAMTVDRFGNVFVAGASFGPGGSDDIHYDIVTVKYDANGNQQWDRRYGVQLFDRGVDLVTDDNGNVYVTGESWSDTNIRYSIVSIKYKPDGTREWVDRYYEEPGYGGAPCDVDYYNGNIFVCGYYFADSLSRIVTIKYNQTGVRQFVLNYDRGTNYYNQSNSMFIDDSGYIYVTGKSWKFISDPRAFVDFITLKYNSEGQLQWSALFNGLGDSDDVAHSVITDLNGNVYVAGNSYTAGTEWDLTLVKYNSAGVRQWVKTYPGNTSRWDLPVKVLLDTQLNPYLIGTTRQGNYHDIIIIKYNPDGMMQWWRKYDGPISSQDYMVDATIDSNKIYVTGISWSSSLFDTFVILKYNSSGKLEWIYRNINQMNLVHFDPASIFIANSNVYLTGTDDENWGDYVTFKFTQPIGIQSISTDIPDKCTLSQNYPNPFNPVTKIKFQVPAGAQYIEPVQLIIYDILGNEIQTLINKNLQPGTYEVTFDGKNLSSGIYFYKLEVEDFNEVKKMVLLK
ncbi:MAG TPA: SBBP repeat-containing protein [Ignavibacteria bacterium]